MGRRLHPTAIDYATVAIAPALIIGLVASLAMFLVDVGYSGEFAWRLKWIMFFFVMAAVLIARIAIEIDRLHAQAYGAALALVTFAAFGRFIDASFLLNAVLIGTTWWCAHRLTYDCTLIDDAAEAKGEGLLQTIGIDAPEQNVEHEVDPADSPKNGQPAWRRFLEERRRHHAPGITVVYFSVAAIPIFGIGQLVLLSRGRTYEDSFRYMFGYVFCSLALLMTTSFLQLRRYVRKRGIDMPDSVAGTWLTGGAIIIVLVMLAALFLPRPTPTSNLATAIQALHSRLHNLSSQQFAIGSDGISERDDGRTARPAPKSETTERKRVRPTDQTEPTTDSASRSSNTNRATDESDDTKQKIKTSPQSNANNSSTNRQSPNRRQSTSPANQRSQPHASNEGSKSQPAPSSGRSPRPSLPMQQFGFAALLRLLYWIGVAFVVLFVCFRYREAIAHAWRQFLKDLRGLFRHRRTGEPELEPQGQHASNRRRFSDFVDPFASNAFRQLGMNELIRYSFEAVEAWSADHGYERSVEQTPVEFAQAVARRHPDLANDFRSLSVLYTYAAYSPITIRNCHREIRSLWAKLNAHSRPRDVSH